MTEVKCGGTSVQGPPLNVIVLADELVPIIAGLDETTRIKYPVPALVMLGIVKLIVPLGLRPSTVAPVKVPIVVGLAKLPEAFDN